jgi:two-component system, chemotaxis family, protein-glutamate methylesterase/glutaminase
VIRVLIADDSTTFRAVLRTVLTRSPDLEVVGEAIDGAQAVEKVLAERPDVVTMDVRMPGQDGIAAIREIMARAPTPVVVVSAEGGPSHQAVVFRALSAGAVEVLAKPSSSEPSRFEREAEAICLAVRAVAGLKLAGRSRPAEVPARRPGPGRRPARAVGLAASTGGPPALARLLSALPGRFPAPILVVQHIAEGFEGGLARWLAGETALSVKLAEHGERLEAATVYIAPQASHLTVRAGAVFLDGGPPQGGFRPSANALFRSLAREFGPSAAGVILTGMGDDGVEGLRDLDERGGATLAQGPASSVVYGMPRAAFERGAARQLLELDDLAATLLALVGPPRGAP